MKRCKHPAHRVWVRPGYAYVQRRYASCTFDGQRKCHACGAVVPYGPSSDSGPHAASVAVEVRAAELAANPDSMRGCGETDDINECEQCGVDDYDTGTDPASPAQWAGYLARAIATHQDPTE